MEKDVERDELFTEFFHRHVRQIRAYARAKARDWVDAEDICSDVFALAWDKLDLLCDLNDAQAHRWLQRVVELRCLRKNRDLSRLVKAYSRVASEMELSPDGEDEESRDDGRQSIELEQRVRDVLDLLPPETRALLELDAFQRKKGPEMAQILGCSPTAARLRLMRARRVFGNIYVAKYGTSANGEVNAS
jgi:RNA polymerase sigma-70 factor (ECF subfamily)